MTTTTLSTARRSRTRMRRDTLWLVKADAVPLGALGGCNTDVASSHCTYEALEGMIQQPYFRGRNA
jgi:hypothetical protein